MRVLHVIQELGLGGAERMVVTLGRRTADAAPGNAVAAVTAGGRFADEFPGPLFELTMVAKQPRRLATAAAQIARAVRAFAPDVVHAHNPAVALAAGLAWLPAGRPPMLTTVHGISEADYRLLGRVRRLVPGPLVACGPGVAASLAAAGAPAEHTVVNGVAAVAPARSRAEVRAELAVPDGCRVVLGVGRLAPPKNQALAVRAVAASPDHVLVLAGAGPDADALAALATDLGAADRVRLLGARDDVPDLLAAADVVVVTSRREGLSLASLEAMGSGTPLVATDVVGVRELLTDGHDALLVPSDDTEALVAALKRLAADPDLGRRVGAEAARTAARYDETSMVAGYLSLYDTIARRGAR